MDVEMEEFICCCTQCKNASSSDPSSAQTFGEDVQVTRLVCRPYAFGGMLILAATEVLHISASLCPTSKDFHLQLDLRSACIESMLDRLVHSNIAQIE